MASVFGHAVLALGAFYISPKSRMKILGVAVIGVVCSALPDADVLTFRYGIPYEHMFGHRGFTHSIFFAFMLSLTLVAIRFNKRSLRNSIWLFLFYFFCTASHGVLDAMTTGGRGIAFFAPFSAERYFLPWRFIQVSPMSASRFFSDWGIAVLKSEFVFIAIPVFVACLPKILIRGMRN